MDLQVRPYGRFQHVVWVAETGSTNDDLVELSAENPKRPLVRLTDLQTTGRGRRDRKWEMAPGGGLLISFYVPWTNRDSAHLVPTCLGNAAVAAIEHSGIAVGLKWPNDLVTKDGKKLGGMLSTAVIHNGAMTGVVAGLGCNVSWPDENALADLPNATSLEARQLEPAGIDRAELASALVGAMDHELGQATEHGAARVHERYRKHCFTLGQRVRVEQTSGDLIGVATDIDPSGALVIDVDGAQHRVDVGDVVHLRPH